MKRVHGPNNGKKNGLQNISVQKVILKAYIIISSGKEQAELSPGEDMD